MLARGRQLYTVFVDYEKAYDYLDRGAIWAKLLKGGVSSKCIRVFHSLYSNMKLEMRGDNRHFESTLGILQGEITSPLFFSFFVCDLEDSLPEESIGISMFDVLIKLRMYFDDMVVFSESKEGLQEGLNNLHTYCTSTKWGLTLNAKKRRWSFLKRKDSLVETVLLIMTVKILRLSLISSISGCSRAYQGHSHMEHRNL